MATIKNFKNTAGNFSLTKTKESITMKHEDTANEFKPFLRKQCADATCADCTCRCKGTRKGCGTFTPTPKFYDDVRAKFDKGER